MIRVAWSSSPGLSRIAALCFSCADLVERKCRLEGNRFYTHASGLPGPCVLCDSTLAPLVA